MATALVWECRRSPSMGREGDPVVYTDINGGTRCEEMQNAPFTHSELNIDVEARAIEEVDSLQTHGHQ